MARQFSVASNFHRQFEEAYAKKVELQSRIPTNLPEIKNKAEYG